MNGGGGEEGGQRDSVIGDGWTKGRAAEGKNKGRGHKGWVEKRGKKK